MRVRGLAVLVVAALAVALAACGSGQRASTTGTDTIDVYSSLPSSGPESGHAAAIRLGIQLALRQARYRVGDLRVHYVELDDSLPNGEGWDPGQTARNATQVAEDTKAVLYVGDFDSGASAVSIPILNKSGIPQISPASTYTGLTTDGLGTELGEPQKYYPTNRRTFVRLAPSDAVQADALLALMGHQGCTNLAVAHDADAYGEGLARLVQARATLGPQVVDVEAVDVGASTYVPYAQALDKLGVDCVLSTAPTPAAAARLLGDVAQVLPRARLYAASSACERAVADPAEGGLPRAAARRFRCLAVPLALRAYPGGRAFAAAYHAAFGAPPTDPWALYGYEAMRLGLDTLRGLGPDASSPDALLDALFRVRGRRSPLGRYSIDPNGDTTLTRFGAYRIAPGNLLVPSRAVSGEAQR